MITSPKTRGKTKKELSLKLNYAGNYLSHAVTYNRLSERAAELIQVVYGISPSEYQKGSKPSSGTLFEKPKSVVKSADDKITLQITIDASALESIIQKAVVEAFEKL